MNFHSIFICLKRATARSLRRNGRCEFSTRLLTQGPISCLSALPSPFMAVPFKHRPSVVVAAGLPWRFYALRMEVSAALLSLLVVTNGSSTSSVWATAWQR